MVLTADGPQDYDENTEGRFEMSLEFPLYAEKAISTCIISSEKNGIFHLSRSATKIPCKAKFECSSSCNVPRNSKERPQKMEKTGKVFQRIGRN